MDQKMIDLSNEALSKGVQFGFIPCHLNIPDRPELGLFPLNVLFAKSKNGENEKIISATALYEPMLSTFKLDQKQCSMEYFNVYGHGSWLLITYDRKNDLYRGEKYVGETKVGGAWGKEWRMFFVHFTMLGLSDGEQCEFNDINSTTKFN
jgi:hypothetical protein